MSEGREDVALVADERKPPVWALVEGRSPAVGGEFTDLAEVRVRSLYGYVGRDLQKVTLEEANELLRAAGEQELSF